MNKKIIEQLKKYVVNTDECITYPYLNKNGYGEYQPIIECRKIHILMHRSSYRFYNGELRNEEVVCHKCDNPACINPKHLFKGTHQDNVRDRVLKDRSAKGSRNGRYIDGRTSDNIIRKIHHHNRSLTQDEVNNIKLLKSQWIKLKDIAKLTGIKYQTIKDISCGRIYK